MVGSTRVETIPPLGEGCRVLQAAGDPVRLAVLQRLAAGPCCACDLQGEPPVPANLLSYHLRVLREAGLVSATRRGRWVDYALAPDAVARLHAALPAAATPAETPATSDDAR